LNTIRSIHQPLDYNQLREHERAYSQKRAENLEKLRKEKEEKILENLKNYQEVRINYYRFWFKIKLL